VTIATRCSLLIGYLPEFDTAIRYFWGREVNREAAPAQRQAL
jgi:hypothetical protein